MPGSELSRARHRLLGEHLVDPEVLADVAQEVDRRQRRGPVEVVDQHAPASSARRSRGTARSARGCAPPRSATISGSLSCAPRVGRGSPIRPVAPPTRASGRWPARCSRRSGQDLDQVPDVQARRGRVEAAVERDRSRGQARAQRVLVGGLGDQAAPVQVVEESSAVVTGPSLPDVPVRRRRRTARPVQARRAGLVGDPEPPRQVASPPADARPAGRRGRRGVGPAGPPVQPYAADRGSAGRRRRGRRPMPSASVSRAGPAGQVARRPRRRHGGRAARSTPPTTSPARSSTAEAVALGPARPRSRTSACRR